MTVTVTRLMGWFQEVEGVKRFIPADQPPPPSCIAVFDVEVEDQGWTGTERLEVAEKDMAEATVLAAAESLALGAKSRADAQAAIDAQAAAAEAAAAVLERARQDKVLAVVAKVVKPTAAVEPVEEVVEP